MSGLKPMIIRNIWGCETWVTFAPPITGVALGPSTTLLNLGYASRIGREGRL